MTVVFRDIAIVVDHGPVKPRDGNIFFKNNCIYLFWLCWAFVAVRAFPSCGERGLLLVSALRLLIAAAFLVAEHGL